MHILQPPSFLGTDNTGDPQGEQLGLMTPWSNNFWICCWISSFSVTEVQYKLKLGREASPTNCMSCSTGLRDDKPCTSSNSSLKVSLIFSISFSCLEVSDIVESVTLVGGCSCGLIINKTNFPQAFTILLAYVVVTKEVVLCSLLGLTWNSFPPFTNRYLHCRL